MKKIAIVTSFVLFACLALWLGQPQKARLELGPDPRQQLTFALDYESDANASSSFTALADPSVGMQSVTIGFKGELGWTVISQDPESTEFLLELTPHLEQSNETAKRLIASKASARVRLKRNGELAVLLMPKDHFNGASVLITDIIRHFIPILSEKEVKGGDLWDSEESSGHGQTIPTRWKLVDLGSELAVLSKQYRETPGQALDAQNSRYELDRASRFLKKVLVNVQSQSPDASRRILSSVKLTATLQTSAKVNAQEMASILLPLEGTKLVRETLSNEMLMQQQEQLVLEKILGSDTVDSMQTQLKAADPKGQNANMPIYNKLKALFILQPQSVDAFAPVLLEYDRLDDRFSMVATALTAVGSPEAQKVLRDAIDRLDADEIKKQRLIPNLSFTHTPTPESEAFLRELAQQDSSPTIRGTAHRALGTVAHNLRGQDPARVRDIFDEYAGALSKAQTKKDITDTLDVLGNIGDPEHMNSAKPFFQHQDPEVRERAYNSLRHIQDPIATETLVQALSEEKVPKVREVIAEALSYQILTDSSWIDRLSSLIYAEQNIVVVKHLLRALSQNSPRFPAAISVIEKYAKDCGHPDLCGYVSSLLEAARTR